jgi:hypothetical protein
VTDRVGYCFLVDPADPFDPNEYELVRMSTLRPGDIFGFVDEADPRAALLLDESAPLERRQAALAELVRDAPRLRFVEERDPLDGCTRCRGEPVEDWRPAAARASEAR